MAVKQCDGVRVEPDELRTLLDSAPGRSVELSLSPVERAELLDRLVGKLAALEGKATELFIKVKCLGLEFDPGMPLSEPICSERLSRFKTPRWEIENKIRDNTLQVPEHDQARCLKCLIHKIYTIDQFEALPYMEQSSRFRCLGIVAAPPKQREVDPASWAAVMDLLREERRPLTRVEPVEGGYRVYFPGLHVKDDFGPTRLVGESSAFHASLEAANAAARAIDERHERESTVAALRRVCHSQGLRLDVDARDDGTFTVGVREGSRYGADHEPVTLEDLRAKVAGLLDARRTLSNERILSIESPGGEHTIISTLAGFRPHHILASTPTALPEGLRKEIASWEARLMDPYATSARNTFEDPRWADKLFSLASRYLEGPGKELKEQLGIVDLRILTPRQAVELSCRIVADLTKYYDDTLKNVEPSPADKGTVMEMLEDGLNNLDPASRSSWKGNGVCRNFAWGVKAVFEALKSNQAKEQLLADTYCVVEAGKHFAPEMVPLRGKPVLDSGHAWNTFVTIAGNEAAVTVADVTWSHAYRGRGQAGFAALDHTLLRAEGWVFRLAEKLSWDSARPELEKLQRYYIECIDKATGAGLGAPDAPFKMYMAGQALSLTLRTSSPIIRELDAKLAQQYQANPDYVTKSVLDSWSQALARTSLPGGGFRRALAEFMQQEWFVRNTAPILEGVNPHMQRMALEELDRSGKLGDPTDGRLRRLVRARFPDLLPEFDPTLRAADADELLWHFKHGGELPSLLSDRLSRMRGKALAPDTVADLHQELKECLLDLAGQAGRREEAEKAANEYSLLRLLREFDGFARRYRP